MDYQNIEAALQDSEFEWWKQRVAKGEPDAEIKRALERFQDIGNHSSVDILSRIKEYVKTLEKIEQERDRIMKLIPECPIHGYQCVPHAIDWVSKHVEIERLC